MPAAKFASMPLQATPMARPAPASKAANEVVRTPKMSRIARIRTMVSSTEMMDLR
ncbi:hypothetical protein D9M69_659900 [compost metagenome]